MKDIYFDEIWELVCKVIDKIKHTDDEEYSVGIVAKYPEAKEVIKEFIMCDADIGTLDIEHPEVDGYEDEYYISVNLYDGIVSVNCYPLKEDDEYYDIYDDIVYIFGDCNSRVHQHCETNKIHALYIGEDELNCDKDCDVDVQCDCGERDCCCEDKHSKDDWVINVTYNLDTKEANRLIDEMEKKLLRVNDIFKEMNTMKSFFGW